MTELTKDQAQLLALFIQKEKGLHPFWDELYEPTFSEAKEYMEKEQAELWEHYIFESFSVNASETEGLNRVLDLSNLITFLLEHREEWGWVEEYSPPMNMEKVKHPALLFAEEKGWIKEDVK